MRSIPLLLFLAGTAGFAQIGSSGLFASAPVQGKWILGVQRLEPVLSARAEGSKDGKASLVDTKEDLGLARDGGPWGIFGEYAGDTHGFMLSYGPERYAGDRILPRDIVISGTPYAAGAHVQSSAKLNLLEGLYMYKFARKPDAWASFDLGVQYFKTDLRALDAATGVSQEAKPSWVVPQIGLTGYSSALDGLTDLRLFYRYFANRGATLNRWGADGRAYFYPSFGLRMFYEESRMRAPRGSLEPDLDLRSDRRVTGFGVVVRF